MLFGKAFYTTITLTAMTISHVACAPTAQSEISVVEKRNSISDTMSTCYNHVQTHCTNINTIIEGADAVITAEVAVTIKTEAAAIVVLLVDAVSEIQIAINDGVSGDDLNTCGNTFILLVNLLTVVIKKVAGGCQPGAITVLVETVGSLLSNIQQLGNILTSGIDGLLSIVGLLLGLLFDLLGALKISIGVSISGFTSACSPF